MQKLMKHIILSITFIGAVLSVQAQKLDRNIFIQTVVDAPVPEVWQAFTTEGGLESFFAPECHIDLRMDGLLDIFFFPDAPEGRRGAEGMRIISVQPNKMFAFTWNNPPELPGIRDQRTHVTFKFFPYGPQKKKTRLALIHDGWGDGEIWDQAYQYFVKAWRDVILFRLHYRFDRGPIDWRNPPVNYNQYNIIMQ